ncbi:hypothetical protein MJ579_11390 [Klebsiella pneumoniae]|nr:hypothetical protein MJ579_11390 [Klebsiella pneumoniae]
MPSRQHAQRAAPSWAGNYTRSPPTNPDSLTSALNKVYQRKGVNISLDISPEITFVGEQSSFMEVMGNVLDAACSIVWVCGSFITPRPPTISAHPGGRRWAGDPRRASAGRFDRGQR